MNRETLFRGKRIDNGEWIEGYFLQLYRSERAFIVPKLFVQRGTLRMSGETPPKIIPIEVLPETVGQYTGREDKNDKKVFEGDILRGFAYPFRDGEGKHNYYAEVVWFKNSPAFGLVTHKNPKSNVVGISEGNCEYMEDWETFLWEVVGNIYDNKELLND